MVRVLNSGYQRGSPILRSKEVKGSWEVEAFEVYGPKIIASREPFDDLALESRFLVEEMGLVQMRADIPRSLSPQFYAEALSLRNKLLSWRLKNYYNTHPEELIIEGINPRLNQIILPMLAIVKDECVREQMITFIRSYSGRIATTQGFSWECEVIIAILQIHKKTGVNKITYKEIKTTLLEDRFGEKDNLTERQLGEYIRKKLQLHGERTRFGYYIDYAKNEERITRWKDRFKITEEDIAVQAVNNVNVVNVVGDVPMITKDDLPF
jgi:hypothetical protein